MSALWGIIAGLGALIVGALAVFSRKSGIDSQKATDAQQTALTQKKMAEAAAAAPRTAQETQEQLRQGRF